MIEEFVKDYLSELSEMIKKGEDTLSLSFIDKLENEECNLETLVSVIESEDCNYTRTFDVELEKILKEKKSDLALDEHFVSNAKDNFNTIVEEICIRVMDKKSNVFLSGIPPIETMDYKMNNDNRLHRSLV